MYRKFYRSKIGMNANSSTFTPPGSVFQSLPDHVIDWMQEIRASMSEETPILPVKSTLFLNLVNCQYKKVTCIKIRNQTKRSEFGSGISVTTNSPILNRSRKYIARLSSSMSSPMNASQIQTNSELVLPTPIKMRSPSTARRRHIASHSTYLTGQPILPSYARIADSLDHVLRICTRLRQLLMMTTSELDKAEIKEEIINKSKTLGLVIQRSAYAFHLVETAYTNSNGLLECLQDISQIDNIDDVPQMTTAFTNVIRKLIEETVHLNCWIIIHYLDDCDAVDCLLPISVNHLIHLLLFESEPCLEVIQSNTMQNLVTLCEIPQTPIGTVQLLLRAMAVLCGVRAACVQLLSLGAFSMVLDYFLNSVVECSIEAAGILCQLTRPNFGLIELGKNIHPVASRALAIAENYCSTPDSLLFCLNILANIANDIVSDNSDDAQYLFDQLNAIPRILKIISMPKMRSALVDEQILSVLVHFPDSINKNDVFPFLFSILENRPVKNQVVHQRLVQKANLFLQIAGFENEHEFFEPIKTEISSSSSYNGSNPDHNFCDQEYL